MLNHSFLGALAAVACRQELLLDLIASNELAGRGALTMQASAAFFFSNDCAKLWTTSVVMTSQGRQVLLSLISIFKSEPL
jgi:hypothetical protein